MPIQHIWFDFSDTIARVQSDAHDRLKHETYAQQKGQPLTDQLKQEFDAHREKAGSVSKLFADVFGLPAHFWSDHVNAVADESYFALTDPDAPKIVHELAKQVSVSVFSNVETATILAGLGFDMSDFTYILGPKDVRLPKPAPDAFRLIIQRSNLPPDCILYVGDSEAKDIIPASSLGLQTCIYRGSSNHATYSAHDFTEVAALVLSPN